MQFNIEAQGISPGFGLTTARILYRLPDRRDLLQLFLWQHYDVAPDFPELERFLDFWQREIEGPLHSVRVAHHLIGLGRAPPSAAGLH